MIIRRTVDYWEGVEISATKGDLDASINRVAPDIPDGAIITRAEMFWDEDVFTMGGGAERRAALRLTFERERRELTGRLAKQTLEGD